MNFAMALGCNKGVQSVGNQLPVAAGSSAVELSVDSRQNGAVSANNSMPRRNPWGGQSWGAAAALMGGSNTNQQQLPDGEAGGSDDDSDDDESSKRTNSRRKILIEPIQDKNKRQITFNKRKNGILKKVKYFGMPFSGAWH
jgi:hypothetical protein